MHIFIDESGSFVHPPAGSSVSVVGALVIPDRQLRKIERTYDALRPSLPKEGDEVKGRLLSEAHVQQVVSLVAGSDALFEATAIDMGHHTEREVSDHKLRHAEGITKNITSGTPIGTVEAAWRLRRRFERFSNQLYAQSMATFSLIERAIEHSTLYYSQRMPEELGSFSWVVDAKDRRSPVDWEDWWSFAVMPVLQSRWARRPMFMYDRGDYSHFARFDEDIDDSEQFYLKGGERGTNLVTLLTDFRFSAKPEAGLELVDILTSATRRALAGSLQPDGWRDLTRLMIHRNNTQYIQIISLTERPRTRSAYPYGAVLDHFRSGGRDLLAD